MQLCGEQLFFAITATIADLLNYTILCTDPPAIEAGSGILYVYGRDWFRYEGSLFIEAYKEKLELGA
jgi:hypothetical protein